MKLTRKQKKYIKKYIKKRSLAEISSHLQVPSQEIESYLTKIGWKQKLIKSTKYEKSLTNTDKIKQNIRLFNFKTFLKENWLVLVILILLVFVSYTNSLGNEFVSDDIGGIVENKNIDKLPFSFAQPISLIRFFQPTISFLAYKLFGMAPFAFRLANITFHLATVITVYMLIYLLSNRITAIFAATITAVHPIMTESITWISGGGYCMYSFFLILAMLFYILTVKEKRYIYLSLVSFALALTISEKAVIFPFILIILSVIYKIRPDNWKKMVAFLAMPALAIAIYFLAKLPERIEWLQTTHYQEAGMANPLVQIPVAITSYLILIFWPNDLTLYHTELNLSSLEYSVRVGMFLTFLGLIIFTFKKNKPVFYWLTFFLISLLPVLTPFGISWIVAERYVYLGSIGIFVTISILLNKLCNINNLKPFIIGLFSITTIALCSRTIIRNTDWKNQDSLWLAAAKTSPSSHQNHNNLGDMYGRHGDLDKAIEEFKKAIDLNPGYGDAFHNLANIYLQQRKIDLAIENYKKATEINPNLWQSYSNLSGIYFRQENYQEAEKYINLAIEVNPNVSMSYYNLAVIYHKLGRENIKPILEKALNLDPENQQAKQLLDSI